MFYRENIYELPFLQTNQSLQKDFFGSPWPVVNTNTKAPEEEPIKTKQNKTSKMWGERKQNSKSSINTLQLNYMKK